MICMNKQDLLIKIKYKMESEKQWDQQLWRSTDTLSEHRGKATVHLELNLMKNVKDSEVPCSRRKNIENLGPLLKQGGYMATKDVDITELPSAYLQWRKIRRPFHLTDAHEC